MINRILIRIKVVQMLYSYLLTKREFKIESAPEKKTRDSVYAYRLYMDLLLMILKLSGQKIIPADKPLTLLNATGENPLSKGPMARSLASVPEIREYYAKDTSAFSQYAEAAQALFNAILDSGAFRDYSKKRRHEIADDVNFWAVILETVVAKNGKFIESCRVSQGFTTIGFNKAIEMAVTTLREYNDTKSSLAYARLSLKDSLEKAYQLYHVLLWLPVEITKLRSDNLEAAKEKYLPTAEDMNPNLRFVDNKFVETVRSSQDMEVYFKTMPFSWDDGFLLKKLLDEILESEIYKEYMEAPDTDYEKDCEFWRTVFKSIIFPSDILAEALESKSVFWNDDLAIMGTFVLKTLRKAAASKGHEFKLLPMYKDEEDENFGQELFGNSISNFKEYRALIDKFIDEKQWDPDRLAFMDIVIMTAAISELLIYPSIPIPVTMNEYIEIANYYSTSRSGQFINGILYSVISYLKAEGRLSK